MIELNLDYYAKPAILFSGGADSTLLYYLAVKHLASINFTGTLDLLLVDRYNNPVDKALKLYEKIKPLVNDNISNIKNIKFHDGVQGYQQLVLLMRLLKNQYDVIFWGVNQYPGNSTIRPRNSEYVVDFHKYESDTIIKLPFAKYNKVDIIKTYIDLGIEDILNQTHTCGENKPEPCGECFNCRERIWAYEQLGLVPNLGI